MGIFCLRHESATASVGLCTTIKDVPIPTAVVSYKRIRVSRGKGTEEGRLLRTHQTLVSGDPFFLGPGSVTIAVEQQRFQLVFLAHDGRRA